MIHFIHSSAKVFLTLSREWNALSSCWEEVVSIQYNDTGKSETWKFSTANKAIAKYNELVTQDYNNRKRGY